MKSLDTNILLYAADEDCREHAAALEVVNDALRSPADWMLADQVLFEMYAGLSTPAFPRRRTYDLVLAVTLRSAGVTEFYTRNVVDFRDAGFTRIVNPID